MSPSAGYVLLWTGLYDVPVPRKDMEEVRSKLLCSIVPSYESHIEHQLGLLEPEALAFVVISVMHPMQRWHSFQPLTNLLLRVRSLRPVTPIFVIPQSSDSVAPSIPYPQLPQQQMQQQMQQQQQQQQPPPPYQSGTQQQAQTMQLQQLQQPQMQQQTQQMPLQAGQGYQPVKQQAMQQTMQQQQPQSQPHSQPMLYAQQQQQLQYQQQQQQQGHQRQQQQQQQHQAHQQGQAPPVPARQPVQLNSIFYASGVAELVDRMSLSIPRRISENEVLWPEIGSKVCSDNSKMFYTIGRRLGEGAYSVVHECKDFFGQPFVLKIIKPQRSKRQVEEDFRKEREFLSKVLHPNVTQMYDSFSHNNLFYYVLERAEGSLRDLLETPPSGSTGTTSSAFASLFHRKPKKKKQLEGEAKPTYALPLGQVVDFTGQMLAGLCHIHKLQIVHRDIQVDNILFKRERDNIVLKISDFGISRLVNAASQFEAIGGTGRGWEIAPELLWKGKTTFRSDIYQLGLIVYHMLSGSPAILASDGDHRIAIRNAVPQQRALALQSPLAPIVGKMLHPDDGLRYQTVYEVWQDMAGIR